VETKAATAASSLEAETCWKTASRAVMIGEEKGNREVTLILVAKNVGCLVAADAKQELVLVAERSSRASSSEVEILPKSAVGKTCHSAVHSLRRGWHGNGPWHHEDHASNGAKPRLVELEIRWRSWCAQAALLSVTWRH
jgi:hypothetical protein